MEKGWRREKRRRVAVDGSRRTADAIVTEVMLLVSYRVYKSNSSRYAPQARYAGEKTAAWGDAGILGAACFPLAPNPVHSSRWFVVLLRGRWKKVRKGGERGEKEEREDGGRLTVGLLHSVGLD